MTAITIRDGQVVPVDPDDETNSILWAQLRKSVRNTCKHKNKIVTNRSRTGVGLCYAGYRCPDCKRTWNEAVPEAEHEQSFREVLP